MSDFLVAYFHTQTDAITSARKLMTCGVQRSHVKMHAENQKKADIPKTDIHHETTVLMASEPAVAPHITSLTESVSLSVSLPNSMMINDVCSVLKDTGAYLIDVTEHDVTQEYPDM